MPGPDPAGGVSSVLTKVSCWAIAGRALLIEGRPGSGKSSLALALIDRGAVLIGDDGITLESREGRLWAAPPPNIAGLIEVRNVGLVALPTCSARLALVARLDETAPRHRDEVQTAELVGCSLPCVAFYTATPALPLRAEYALKMHGLA